MRILSILLAIFFSCIAASAQVAIKTNVLYDATTTPNLGLEIGAGKRNTVNLVYGLNLWSAKTSDGAPKKLKHWVLMPEYRWWLCTRYNGHFLGVHALTGQFNAANVNVPLPGVFFAGDPLRKYARDGRVEATFAGAGFTYGYQWSLSKHWNIEAEIGAGYAHVWDRRYNCGVCSNKLSSGDSNYLGITKIGLSLLYLF